MKFLMLVLTIFQRSLGQMSTTPAWMNIELMMNYLKAYPSLKNLSSTELGLPDGIDFMHSLYRGETASPQSNSTTETTTQFLSQSGKSETSPETTTTVDVKASKSITLSSQKSFTTATQRWRALVTTTIPDNLTIPFSSFAYTSRTSQAITDDPYAQADHRHNESRASLSCWRCLKSNTSSSNCITKDCTGGQCILGYVFPLSSSNRVAMLQMCSEGNWPIDFSGDSNSTEDRHAITTKEEFQFGAHINTVCRNDTESQLTFNRSGIMYSINENFSGEYHVRYLCCDNSLCNDFDDVHQDILNGLSSNNRKTSVVTDEDVVQTSSTENTVSASTASPNTTLDRLHQVTSRSTPYTDLTTERSSAKHFDTTSGFSQQNATSSTIQTKHFEASGYTTDDAGSSSGLAILQDTTISSKHTDSIRSKTIYYTENVSKSHRYLSTSMNPLLHHITSKSEYASGSGSYEDVSIFELTAAADQKLLPEYTKPTSSGDGDIVSSNQIPTSGSETQGTVDHVTATAHVSRSTQTNAIATPARYGAYTNTYAAYFTRYPQGSMRNVVLNTTLEDWFTSTQTPEDEQTRYGQASELYETASSKLYLQDRLQPTYDTIRSSSARATRSATKISTTSNKDFGTSFSTADNFATSLVPYRNSYEDGNSDYVEFIATSAQYLSRLLLLLNNTIDITSLTFLTNLERNLEFAYAKASRMTTATDKIGVLSRKLLDLHHVNDNQFNAEVAILHRISSHAVLVEFAIKKDQTHLQSKEVARIISQLPLDELSKILGIPVLSPVIPSNVETAAVAWMTSALVIIPLMSITVIVLCYSTLKKKSKTTVKEITSERQIHRYPDSLERHQPSVSPAADTHFRMTSIGVGPDCVFSQPTYEEVYTENECASFKDSAKRLPTVKEEIETNSLKSPSSKEEIDNSSDTIQEITALPNSILENAEIYTEKRAVENNANRLVGEGEPNIMRQHSDVTTVSSLPPITHKTAPLVVQSFPKNWFVSQEESCSSDGVPEIDANLRRLRTRIKRAKDAERRRNKIRLQQRSTNLTSECSQQNSVTGPTNLTDVCATQGQLVATNYENGNSLGLMCERIPKTFCSNTEERTAANDKRKKKRKKLLMTILKDWENRHLDERTERQDMSPACRMALEAKIQRWTTTGIQDNRSYYPNAMQQRLGDCSSVDDNEVQFIRMVRIPAYNDA